MRGICRLVNVAPGDASALWLPQRMTGMFLRGQGPDENGHRQDNRPQPELPTGEQVRARSMLARVDVRQVFPAQQNTVTATNTTHFWVHLLRFELWSRMYLNGDATVDASKGEREVVSVWSA